MTVLAFPSGRPLAPFHLQRIADQGHLVGLTYSRSHRQMVLVSLGPPVGLSLAEAAAAAAEGRAWFDPDRWKLVVR